MPYLYTLAYEQRKLQGEDLRKYISMLSEAGFIDIFNLDLSTIVERIDDIKKDSGIPCLKQHLKGLFKSTRSILYAKMDEAFQDFLKQIHDIVVDGTESCNDRLSLLAAKESELYEIRAELDKVETATLQLKKYMEKLEAEMLGMK